MSYPPVTNTLSYSLLRTAFAAVAAISLSACVLPYHFTDAPAVGGQVVDCSSRHPIRNATVTMTANAGFLQARRDSANAVEMIAIGREQTHTASDGTFHLAAQQHWGFIPYPSDGVHDPAGALQIEAIGYRPYLAEETDTEYSHWIMSERGAEDLRHLQIELTPVPKHTLPAVGR